MPQSATAPVAPLANASDEICYFGYGSLVNARTLPKEAQVIPGVLSGWLREWRLYSPWDKLVAGTCRGVCALTVIPSAGTKIYGGMMRDHRSNLAALDARESRYFRQTLEPTSFQADEAAHIPEGCFLYQASEENYHWGTVESPMLQSYVDCVLQGFHDFWGEAGIDHFINTTRGWDRVPMLMDRGAPFYPRAQHLPVDLAALIDAKLAPLAMHKIEL
ncbi:gamma-glutamylcyclotransferase family protein [Polycladidibacter hongkongensis]|uniref:gamma-glutamylcyclotransferase family protein n=1 Tax=Polycladidibacter hongkongensis TaxID=1647556 RepID=UPI0008362AB0|nr:gamma-glutamylcyclotransferase family protein [Pseudovibrio hongkongensis]